LQETVNDVEKPAGEPTTVHRFVSQRLHPFIMSVGGNHQPKRTTDKKCPRNRSADDAKKFHNLHNTAVVSVRRSALLLTHSPELKTASRRQASREDEERNQAQ